MIDIFGNKKRGGGGDPILHPTLGTPIANLSLVLKHRQQFYSNDNRTPELTISNSFEATLKQNPTHRKPLKSFQPATTFSNFDEEKSSVLTIDDCTNNKLKRGPRIEAKNTTDKSTNLRHNKLPNNDMMQTNTSNQTLQESFAELKNIFEADMKDIDSMYTFLKSQYTSKATVKPKVDIKSKQFDNDHYLNSDNLRSLYHSKPSPSKYINTGNNIAKSMSPFDNQFVDLFDLNTLSQSTNQLVHQNDEIGHKANSNFMNNKPCQFLMFPDETITATMESNMVTDSILLENDYIDELDMHKLHDYSTTKNSPDQKSIYTSFVAVEDDSITNNDINQLHKFGVEFEDQKDYNLSKLSVLPNQMEHQLQCNTTFVAVDGPPESTTLTSPNTLVNQLSRSDEFDTFHEHHSDNGDSDDDSNENIDENENHNEHSETHSENNEDYDDNYSLSFEDLSHRSPEIINLPNPSDVTADVTEAGKTEDNIFECEKELNVSNDCSSESKELNNQDKDIFHQIRQVFSEFASPVQDKEQHENSTMVDSMIPTKRDDTTPISEASNNTEKLILNEINRIQSEANTKTLTSPSPQKTHQNTCVLSPVSVCSEFVNNFDNLSKM